MIQIKFTASGANSMIGSFARGDIARLSDTFARHLVEEARVAEYLTPTAATTETTAGPRVDAKKPRKIIRRKAPDTLAP